MTRNKILIVGGGGFIGSHLAHRLIRAGQQVQLFDKVPSETHSDSSILGDVRDRDALAAAACGADAIYNLAAEHRDNVRPESLYDEVNVGGAENVVAAAEAHDIRQIVFTSTVAVYPFSQTPLDERAEPAPFNDYGRTKLLAENVHRGWQERDGGRSLIIVRPTAVFGEGNRGNVYNLINQIARGHFLMVGDGCNRKSLAYVENVAAALEYVLNLGPGSHLFNYADQPDFDMNTLVSEVRRALGQEPASGIHFPKRLGLLVGQALDIVASLINRNFPVSRIRVEKFCANTRFDCQRIRQAGFEPEVKLNDGLRRMVEAEFKRRG